ncbi:phosphotransferase family protein [Crossiella sp. NPDC003009]
MLPSLSTEEEYAQALGDPAVWLPVHRAALAAANLPLPARMWLAGRSTYPTALTGSGLVVKLFTPFWHGPDSIEAERAAYRLLAADPALPVPELLADGELAAGWSYLVCRRLPGLPLTTLSHRWQFSAAERTRFAEHVGAVLCRLHQLALPSSGRLAASSSTMTGLLHRRLAEAPRERRAAVPLRRSLLDELTEWQATFVGSWRPPEPVLVHGDLSGEHLLVSAGRLTGLIDFGEAQTGDRRYDVVSLHLGAFEGDVRMLRAFAAGYGDPGLLGAPEDLLGMSLCHDFELLGPLLARRPELAAARGAAELAEWLWGLGA